MNASVPDTRLRVSELLRAAWPISTAKHAASASGQSYRTAEGWLSERCTPSAMTLFRMAERNDRLRRELLTRLAYMEAERNEGTLAGILPVDGSDAHDARRTGDGSRHVVAKEG